MSEGLKISEGGPAFANIFAAIHEDCFDEAWSENAFLDLLKMPGAYSFIALESDQPVGFILCRLGGGECEVITIGVLKNHQRKRIASVLLHEAVGVARSQAVGDLLLEVARSNEAAKALYLSQGFIEVGMRKNYYKRTDGQREDALVFKKTLA